MRPAKERSCRKRPRKVIKASRMRRIAVFLLGGAMMQKNEQKPLTEQEQKVLDRIRALEYGTVEIIVKRGRPVFVNTKKEEKLD